MKRLELVQRLLVEGGIPGNVTATTNQTGEAAQLVGWIDQAYLDILISSRHWLFMRGEFSLPMATGTNTYLAADAGITDLQEWANLDDWRVWKTVITDEQYLEYVEWNEFKYVFQLGTSRTQTGRPLYFSIKPDFSLIFNPVPNFDYTVIGEYQKSPTQMIEGGSPVFPAEYHMAIVWKALMLYAAYHAEPDKYAHGENQARIVMTAMRQTQLPRITI